MPTEDETQRSVDAAAKVIAALFAGAPTPGEVARALADAGLLVKLRAPDPEHPEHGLKDVTWDHSVGMWVAVCWCPVYKFDFTKERATERLELEHLDV